MSTWSNGHPTWCSWPASRAATQHESCPSLEGMRVLPRESPTSGQHTWAIQNSTQSFKGMLDQHLTFFGFQSAKTIDWLRFFFLWHIAKCPRKSRKNASSARDSTCLDLLDAAQGRQLSGKGDQAGTVRLKNWQWSQRWELLLVPYTLT